MINFNRHSRKKKDLKKKQKKKKVKSEKAQGFPKENIKEQFKQKEATKQNKKYCVFRVLPKSLVVTLCRR